MTCTDTRTPRSQLAPGALTSRAGAQVPTSPMSPSPLNPLNPLNPLHRHPRLVRHQQRLVVLPQAFRDTAGLVRMLRGDLVCDIVDAALGPGLLAPFLATFALDLSRRDQQRAFVQEQLAGHHRAHRTHQEDPHLEFMTHILDG